MKLTLLRFCSKIALLAVCLILAACATIEKAAPSVVRCDLEKAESVVTRWVNATYARSATLWQDGVIYTVGKDSPELTRIELEWNAPDLHVREVFATVYLRDQKSGSVQITVEERRDNVPLGRRFQDVATKLRGAFVQAGIGPE